MQNVIKKLVLLTPFAPKLELFIPLYPIEMLLIFVFLFRSKIFFVCNYSYITIIYFILATISLCISSLHLNAQLINELFLIGKYIVPVILYSYLRERQVKLEYNDYLFILCLIGCNLAIVYFYSFASGTTLGEAMWGYSPLTRVVGFTGYTVGHDGLSSIGNNSVAFGVFLGLLFIIANELVPKKSWHRIMGVIIIGLALVQTFSRSGVIVILVYAAIKWFEAIRSMKVSIFGALMTIFIFSFVIVFSDSLGVLAKLSNYDLTTESNTSIRLAYWESSFTIWTNTVFNFLFGTGYSETVQYSQYGFPNSESLFFTSVIQGGLVGTSLLMLVFVSFYRKSSLLGGENKLLAIGLNYFIPGWFIANVVGGDLLHTDFLIYYIMLLMAVIDNEKDSRSTCRSTTVRYQALYR